MANVNGSRPKWAAYNQYQTEEARLVLEMLYQLCIMVEEPERTGRGRPPKPLGEKLFAAICKIYTDTSARREVSMLEEIALDRYIDKSPHFNTILNTLRDEAVTPVLEDFIRTTSIPLADIETEFAIDGTGFTLKKYASYQIYKYKHYGNKHWRQDAVWIMAHAAAGVKTGIVTAVETSSRPGQDAPLFSPLFEKTKEIFNIEQIYADKAYCSHKIYRQVQEAGARAYIPFTKKALPSSKKMSSLWNEMHHMFFYHKEEFDKDYGKRQRVETVFSQIKTKLGSHIRSRTYSAQRNEILCKFICHNLSTLARCIVEFEMDVKI